MPLLQFCGANLFLLALLIWLAGARPAAAQVQLGWRHTYEIASVFSYASSLVVDDQSNVCVLGTSGDDFVTLKYAPDGAALWTNRYEAASMDRGVALATDAAGGVCITGNSGTNTSDVGASITTVKYAPDGAWSWARTFREASAMGTTVSGLAMDGAGNAYVGGASILSTAPSYVQRCLLVKYSPAGEELWSRQYAQTSGISTAVRYLALDSAGNAMVSGEVRRENGTTSLFVVKYSPDGNVLWAKEEVDHESEHAGAFLTGLKMDAAGNIFVSGSVLRTSGSVQSTRYHYLTAKYSPAGELLWVVARPPADGYGAVTRALEVDPAGNPIVTGYEYFPVSEDEDEYNIVTVKYDANGTQLWSARSTFDRQPARMALDPEGNVYVGGVLMSAGGDALVLKYSPAGSQLWELQVLGTLLDDLAVAPSGMVGLVGVERGVPGIQTQAYFQANNPSRPTAVITPAYAEVVAGSNITLSAQVSGVEPFTYQWRWFGYQLAGQTSATLVVSNTPAPYGGDAAIDYTVLVRNAVGQTISPEARLVFRYPAAILSPPQSYSVIAGTQVSFSASVRGSPPLSLQWRFNGLDLPGATNSILSLFVTSEAQSGDYSLVASNAYGRTNSLPYQLAVLPGPLAFVRQPSHQYARVGETVTFEAQATGTEPLSYQWYYQSSFDPLTLPGATGPALTLSNVQPAQVGSYFVTVTDATGVITSQVARLMLFASSISATNPQSILIRDHTSAAPYPSTIAISGVTGAVAKVLVTLDDVNHTYLSDLDILLVGPGGQSVLLLSDAGSESEVNHATIVFDDNAGPVPESVASFGGTFKPTNLDAVDAFLPPAPGGSYGDSLSLFEGADPNGSWSLYVIDDESDDVGTIVGGWHLTLFSSDERPGTDLCDPLANWLPRTAGTNLSLNSVTFGAGRFVAVGQNGSVATSTDGLVWINPVSGGFPALNAVTYGNDRFVAVGPGVLRWSTDGLSWNTSAAGGSFSGIAFGDGKFVAVTDNGVVFITTNGFSLTPVYSTALISPGRIAYGDGRFVAVGRNAGVLVSTNGTNWTVGSVGAPRALAQVDVTFGRGLFVAVGDDLLATSPDGLAWTLRHADSSPSLTGIAFGDGRFVAVGNTSNLDEGLIASLDGVNWFRYALPKPGTWNAIAYGNATFIVAGDAPNGSLLRSVNEPIFANQPQSQIVCASEPVSFSAAALPRCRLTYQWQHNGLSVPGATNPMLTIAHTELEDAGDYQLLTTDGTFTRASSVATLQVNLCRALDHWTQRAPPGSNAFVGLACGTGGVVAVGRGGAIARSMDGLDWSSLSIGSNVMLNAVLYEQGQFVAVGTAGVILTSSNAVDWTRQDSGVTNNLGAIVYGNGVFLATAPGLVLRSPDGVLWTTYDAGTNSPSSEIVFAHGLFVSVGASGRIVTSNDGLDWTPRASGVTGQLHGVAWGQGAFVAVGFPGVILRSTNGTDWLPQSSPTNLRLLGVTYGLGQFVAVGVSDVVLASPEGMTWTLYHSTTVSPFTDVIACGDTYFARTLNGQLWQSRFARPPALRGRTSEDGFVLEVTAELGLPFRVQATTLLSPANADWVTMEALTNSHSVTTLQDAAATGVSQRFYRVVSP